MSKVRTGLELLTVELDLLPAIAQRVPETGEIQAVTTRAPNGMVWRIRQVLLRENGIDTREMFSAMEGCYFLELVSRVRYDLLAFVGCLPGEQARVAHEMLKRGNRRDMLAVADLLEEAGQTERARAARLYAGSQ